MARPKILDDMKVTSISLDRSDMEILEREKGILSASAFLRNLIRETQGEFGENKKLKKELRNTKAKLEVLERKEEAITQEHKDATRIIAEGFVGYQTIYPNASRSQRDNWLGSRCKDSDGVRPTEVISYLSLGG